MNKYIIRINVINQNSHFTVNKIDHEQRQRERERRVQLTYLRFLFLTVSVQQHNTKTAR